MSLKSKIEPKVYSRDEHNISRNNIDHDALKIMYRLNNNGFKGYLVGGGVRDLLLGKKPKDFDIATDATPRQIKNIFRNCRIIGKRFKLAHIYFKDNKIIELATFRSDNFDPADETSETELLPKDNNYGEEQDDALRRDATINALFYNISDFSVIDYVGGYEDLQNKIVKLIGEPNIRIKEDPVRALRIARHAARNNFRIEEKTEEALVSNAELLAHCPSMRIYEEFKKDFLSGHSYNVLRLYKYYGLLQPILPELCKNHEFLDDEAGLLPRALKKFDLHQRLSGSEAVTAALSIIAIALHPKMSLGQELNKCFEDEDELFEYLKALYKNYAVPRKERERIFEILNFLTLLETQSFEEISKKHRLNEISIKQLLIVVKCLEGLPRQEEFSLFLKSLKKSKKQERYSKRGRGRLRKNIRK